MVRAGLAAALLAFAPGAHSAPPLTRVAADRPDDVTGPQIHFVYALPRDGQDRSLDTNGAIARSARSFTAWLAQQTEGPTVRLDTFRGGVDVTFVRLDQTGSELEAYGAFARDRVEAELDRRGLLSSGRVYDVYYDGPNPYACGGAPWPPQIPGRVVTMYLHGLGQASVPCDSNPLGLGLGYWEFAMLHDTLHALGFVATCAPHHARSGHVGDSPRDLMWSGDAPWVLPPVLDIGHDDYFRHGRADCPDLADSPYLTNGIAVLSLAVATPRIRRRLTATLRFALDGGSPTAAGTSCAARIGRKALAGAPHFAAGSASCSWRLPAGTRGRTVNGSVEVTVAGQTARRTFARRVRGA